MPINLKCKFQFPPAPHCCFFSLRAVQRTCYLKAKVTARRIVCTSIGDVCMHLRMQIIVNIPGAVSNYGEENSSGRERMVQRWQGAN
jgi:hypothetical protein